MIPGWGAKMPHASGPKVQSLKQKQHCNKFHKDFKHGPHPKQKTNKQKKTKQTPFTAERIHLSEESVCII